MARAPYIEQEFLLHKVITLASDELREPIKRIEDVGGRVDCYSKSKQVSLAYECLQGGYYEQESSNSATIGTFHPTVGGLHWRVWVVTKARPRKTMIARAFSKVLRRRDK